MAQAKVIRFLCLFLSFVFLFMSYHSPWEWTDTQFKGFKDALQGLNVEYKVLQMNAKNNSSPAWKETMGRSARNLINTWRPDLVYTSDDEALRYVTKYYLNSDLPFVFSGVNNLPTEFQSASAKNVSGVLEVEHFIESASLFSKIAPNAKRIAVVFDNSPIWEPVRQRMQEKAVLLPMLDFVYWDTIHTFAEYQRKIKEYQKSVDGICLVGIFNFKDRNGNNVHYRDVLQWTAANSKLPDFSFWIDRISYGTLAVVSVSGYEQGFAAGKIAWEIITGGKSPADLPVKPTVKGRPGISLARAKALGLKIDSKILLSSKVVGKYDWEKK